MNIANSRIKLLQNIILEGKIILYVFIINEVNTEQNIINKSILRTKKQYSRKLYVLAYFANK